MLPILPLEEALWLSKNGDITLIIVGHTLSTDDSLLETFLPNTIIHTNERFLPKILVDAGFFKSNGEVRRQRPELVIHFEDKLSCEEIRLAKNGPNKNKLVVVCVGFISKETADKVIKEIEAEDE